MSQPRFTPTQQRIMDLLSDLQPHTKEELVACLDDEYSETSTIRVHLTLLRAVLRPFGQTVVSENHGGGNVYYRLGRQLGSPYRG